MSLLRAAESEKNFTSTIWLTKVLSAEKDCDGQKSAIPEKEMAIFELRKVLFPEKHLRELPGACPKNSPSGKSPRHVFSRMSRLEERKFGITIFRRCRDRPR